MLTAADYRSTDQAQQVVALVPAFLCPIFWRKLVEKRIVDFYNVLCVIAIAVALIGAMRERHDVLTSRLLWWLLTVYVIDLIASRGFLMSLRRETGDKCWLEGDYEPIALHDRPLPASPLAFHVGDAFPKASIQSTSAAPSMEVDCEWKLKKLSEHVLPLSGMAAVIRLWPGSAGMIARIARNVVVRNK
jgi:hypothetical protein